MKVLGPLAGEVHGAERVLEPRMLRSGENPPRALQLVDAAKALQPRGVDEILFGRVTRHTAWPTLRDAKVSIDGIARQVDPGILGSHIGHIGIISVKTLLAEGIGLFNKGDYWEAHEVWEREWMPDRKGPDSGFYKGLIQIAAGCLHYTRHNRRGAVNKWRSGADYLRPYLPAHKGVRLTSLVRTVDDNLAAMTSPGWPELAMPSITQE
jgi:predicted metal-dependent hydrolase